ncbi:MAG: hypothetical protein NTY04_03440 [Candidatus Staskawiczbacteria bacterium]|nr:hypothetical protein [Candidatus Staskawiczbacteria bacterium]
MESQTKTCQNCRKDFIIEPDDFKFYGTIHVSAPTWCPECRLKRRLNWQGYRILYKRNCDFTKESILSTHHPDSGHVVYKQDIWWSDKWDPKSYGRDYDFSKSFFEQFHELIKSVPLPSLYTVHTAMVDSDYCNAASYLKNCYLCFRITGGEDSAYLNTIVDGKNSFDCFFLNHSERCYASVRVNKSYNVFYSENCEECQDVWFSKDLSGCSNCTGCINIRNKQYCVFNKQYSKEDYKNLFAKLDFGTLKAVEDFKEKTEKFMLKQPRKALSGRKNFNVSGEYISNSKNVLDSYLFNNGEDLRFCQFLKDGPAAKSYDWSFFGDKGEWIYECCWTGLGANNNKFGSWNYSSHDIEYCFGCHNSGNLFGCVGVRKGDYCILNKQYSKSDYMDLVGRIKKQMSEMPYVDSLGRNYFYGEMLPPEMSPWTYNESSAYEWFPIGKKQAIKEGYLWRDSDIREYIDATIKVPNHIKDVKNEIIKEILKCESCGKNYKIIKMELDFYRKMNIPIPKECPLCRDYARIAQLNPMKIYNRKCDKCSKDIQTSYAPDRPEIIYCEQCYQQELV